MLNQGDTESVHANALLRKPLALMASLNDALETAPIVSVRGRVKEVLGTVVRATAPSARIGEMCVLHTPGETFRLEAEVIGFSEGDALLAPVGDMRGVSSSTIVTPGGHTHKVAVGMGLMGRVIDGFGRPLDGGDLPLAETYYPVYADAPHPLHRRMIDSPMHMGVRSLDGMLACGEGQRLGIFAAAGCGKSTLMGMLAKNADVDVTVIALIGERGREVREFVERELGPDGMRRAVVVCTTSEKAPMERLKAGFLATAVAEYFRDQGKRVLLLMDSLTRLARAQRELGLMAGEPPTRRGFPPSVFAMLPRLLERAGMSDRGSITAFYTVLVEGDDMNEPVADESRSILDGHIVLSRKLAAAGHYPAVDVLASVSRVMNAVVSPEHRRDAEALRALMARHDEVELLVRLGEYKRGSDALADKAIDRMTDIRAFLCQRPSEKTSASDMLRLLRAAAA